MQFQKVGKDYLINIDKDEKVVETLTRFCKENGIKNAKLSALELLRKLKLAPMTCRRRSTLRGSILKSWNYLVWRVMSH